MPACLQALFLYHFNIVANIFVTVTPIGVASAIIRGVCYIFHSSAAR